MTEPQGGQKGFMEKTKSSLQMYEKAKDVIPGGVTANIKYFAPYPIFMEKGEGSHLFDVDGNGYIDYLLCYGALILGHGHPAVVNAVQKQMIESGTTVFGSPHSLEGELAEKLVSHFPGVEMVRFTNSGLEATLLAIRVAQAYTGRIKIAKFEGHYHGGYDEVLLSVNPDVSKAGSATEPKAVPDSKGISSQTIDNTIILPFNDLDSTETILRKNHSNLAAVIMEPVQAGFIPANQEFMQGLRKITEELNIPLIFDEVKTGYRLTLGGAQSVYKVTPDLTALGKVLGGGFPIGAVGGKKELMNLMAPDQGRDVFAAGKIDEKEEVLFHSGTYNGHPVVLSAGLATIKELERPNVMENMLNHTALLRSGLEKLYREHGIPMITVGMGSIFNIVFTDKEIKDYRDLKRANTKLREKIDYELLQLGVYTKPLNRYSLSIVHTEKDIYDTVEAHEKAIKLLKEGSNKEGTAYIRA